jgi:hypothetical protein
MSETPNLDRFLQTKELWEEYMELSDELRILEGKLRVGTYKLAVFEGKANESYPIARRDTLQVRNTELAGVLRNTFHLEV